MNLKELGKHLKRAVARVPLYICSLTVRVLPSKCLYGFADIIAFLGYNIARKQQRIAHESLYLAFGGELNDKERTKIAIDCFRNMAKSGVELFYVLERPEICRDMVVIEGREHLDEAFSKAKGVIVVSAHFGNFPLAIIRLSLENYTINIVLRRMRDERIEAFLAERRRKIGINSIHSTPRQACVDNCLRHLRNNEMLFIQLDQNFGSGGVFVDFFDRKAATATGPVVFSLRTGSPILPLFIVRQTDNTHRLIIEPEIILEKKESPEETRQCNIQRITAIIESYIKKYPAEWGWIHRRWKSKPAG